MYKKNSSGIFMHIDFIIIDLLWFVTTIFLSFNAYIEINNLLESFTYRNFLVVVLLVHVIVSVFSNSYKDILRREFLRELLSICKHIFMVLVFSLIILFFMKVTVLLSRVFMVYVVVLSVVGEFILHNLWKKAVHYKLKSNPRQLVLVTDIANAKRLLATFANEVKDFAVAGIVLLGEEYQDVIEGIPVVGNTYTMMDYLRENVVDEVLFSIPEGVRLDREVINKCSLMGITIHVEFASMYGMSDMKYNGNFAGTSVMTNYLKMVTPGQTAMKRLMDICGAIVGLIITGILTIFVAPAIYLSDPGPIFFKQERVGKNGRTFKMYKFRSMYKDAEARKAELMEKNEMSGQMFKMENDPRIIGSGPDGTRHGVGHFIRSTSIDEFPQFWNVLVGDLSLVGTRPPLVSEVSEYDLNHHARLAVKPGITGLWQAGGRSDIDDFEEVVRLDTEYIQNWSIGLDIIIILKTVWVVLSRKGSK